MRKGHNIYKRRDGRWEGRYTKGRKENGRIHYGYVYGKSFGEVKAKLYPLKAKYEQLREKNGEATIAFQEWGAVWLMMIQSEVKESTYGNYYYKLNKYVFPKIGDYGLNELTVEIGAEMVAELIDLGLAISTIGAILRIINQCLNEAKRKGQISENPFALIKLPKSKSGKTGALTREEQRKLEIAAITERKSYGLPTLLSLYSGMRIGEISALQWKDIDFDTNLIRVKHTFQRIMTTSEDKKTELVYTNSKTDSSVRVVPLSDSMRTLLWDHKKQAKGEFVFSNKVYPPEPRLLTYHFHRIRKKAGLENVHFHQLRHTFATRCIETQGDIASVSAILGHRSTQMTLDTYTDALLEQRIQVVKQMERSIA
ncbi:site-specific integrase [Enterococcus florum]|uniref:Site-specific integrase n=1 Tax=Enterococcus florum TaxID=2480627 RepID=A0A4P5PBU2_9ENTE|nr:site-specific integrase [Enterococcus florum]GCF95675.1 site-specific integrase [Enterococcus florum]